MIRVNTNGEAAVFSTNLPEILADVADEVGNMPPAPPLPNGTGDKFAELSDSMGALTLMAALTGELSWVHMTAMSFFQVASETDPEALRFELTKLAALAVSWIQQLDGK